MLIKAVAGGGGRGMRRVDAHVEFEAALEAAAREAVSAFGDPRVLIEKYVAGARHIEVQVFGDGHGNVVHLFERDCSLQRRRQKVVEESPAPGLPEATRAAMCEAAVAAARAVGYVGAGTVEFLVDPARGLGPDSFYFLEMNARLQVEHPVTEAITGLDLVEWQFRVAAGEALPLEQADIRRSGAAIEARLNAEDPEAGFLPSPGRILALRLDPGPSLRVDAGVEADDEVTPFYDSLIAKLIVQGPDRQSALDGLRAALREALVVGPKTNLAFLDALLADPAIQAGGVDVGFIDANAARLGAEPRPPDPRAVLAGAAALIAPPTPRRRRRPMGRRRFVRTDGAAQGRIRDYGRRPRRAADRDRSGVRSFVWLRRRPRRADGRAAAARDQDRRRRLCPVRRQADPRRARRPAGRRRGRARGGSGEVAAPMHGRLIALSVEEGDEVVEGQRLAVVEAMKMEHALVAPRAGRGDSPRRQTRRRSRTGPTPDDDRRRRQIGEIRRNR